MWFPTVYLERYQIIIGHEDSRLNHSFTLVNFSLSFLHTTRRYIAVLFLEIKDIHVGTDWTGGFTVDFGTVAVRLQ